MTDPHEFYHPGAQHPQQNVGEITDNFLQSPMMTQFSEEESTRKGQYQGRPDTAPGHQPSTGVHPHQHQRPNPQQTYGSGFNKPDSHSTTNYSKFHEDQVLFKSNGFDNPSSMANDSAVPHHGMTTQLPHSPQLRP